MAVSPRLKGILRTGSSRRSGLQFRFDEDSVHPASYLSGGEYGRRAVLPSIDSPVTYSHLCAGIHALKYAWDPHGFQCVLICESDADRASVCEAATGLHCHRDAWTCIAECGLVAHDVCVGGPPCQQISRMGPQGGLKCRSTHLIIHMVSQWRNVPWWKQPKILLIENVVELLSIDDGQILKLLTRAADKAGFVPSVFRLEAFMDWETRGICGSNCSKETPLP